MPVPVAGREAENGHVRTLRVRDRTGADDHLITDDKLARTGLSHALALVAIGNRLFAVRLYPTLSSLGLGDFRSAISAAEIAEVVLTSMFLLLPP